MKSQALGGRGTKTFGRLLASALVVAVIGVGICADGDSEPPHPSRISQGDIYQALPMTGRGQMQTIVALGDSVPSGHGATSFIDMVGQQLAVQRSARSNVINDAVDGYTSSDVLAQMDDPKVTRDVASANLIVLEVGANDLSEGDADNPDCAPVRKTNCYKGEMQNVRKNLHALIAKLRTINPHATIVVMGYWNVFKDGTVGDEIGGTYVEQGEELARWINAGLRHLAHRNDLVYVDAYTPFFSGGDVNKYLQADGDHPNDKGHELLANAVLKALGFKPSA